MDAFVIKTPKERPAPRPVSPDSPVLVQSKIEDCKGVLKLDTLLKLCEEVNAIAAGGASLDDKTNEQLGDALRQLERERMTVEVLRSTRVGESINKLRERARGDAAALANTLYVKWKSDAHAAIKKEVRIRRRLSGGDKHDSPGTPSHTQTKLPLSAKLSAAKSARSAVALMREMEEWEDAVASAVHKRPRRGSGELDMVVAPP